MKRFLLLLIIIGFVAVNDSFSQNTDYKNGISFKKLFLDYQSQNGGDISAFKNYRHGFEIGLHRHLNKNIKIVIPFHMGVVNSSESVDCLKKNVYGVDAQVNYQFIKEGSSLVPYFIGGVGIVGEKVGEMNIQVPIGLGVNFMIQPNAFINWQSSYRYSFSEDRSNLQHGIGFTYLFGNKNDEDKPKEEMEEELIENIDSDGDGVSDDLDLCPQDKGVEALRGCPDTDGDGVPDYEDDCIEFAGLKSLKGCPDSDGDGVSDNDDECPNIKGTVSNKGCPAKNIDTDGDGVMDNVDNCPHVAGHPSNKGCPRLGNTQTTPTTQAEGDRDGDGVLDSQDSCPDAPGLSLYRGCPDSDGDGIDDGRDKCPNASGPVANNGCPELKAEDRETLEVAMRAVQFNSGKSTIKSSSYRILKQIKGIMDRYPGYSLVIEGHTDNTGRASVNQNLSERRAKACFTYLVKQGVNPSRMSSAGYGETRPIASNNTLSGRTLNRRVEFNLIP